MSLVTLYGSHSSCLSNHSSNAFNTSVKGIAVSCHTLAPTMQVTRTMRSTVAIITVQQIHEIAEETPQQYSEGNHHFSSSQAKTCMKKLRVVITLWISSDNHLHNEWQWLAAITHHWPCQIPTVGVDKYIITCSEFWVRERGVNLSRPHLPYFPLTYSACLASVIFTGRTNLQNPKLQLAQEIQMTDCQQMLINDKWNRRHQLHTKDRKAVENTGKRYKNIALCTMPTWWTTTTHKGKEKKMEQEHKKKWWECTDEIDPQLLRYVHRSL